MSLLLGPEADVAPAESVSAASVGQSRDFLLSPVTGQLTEPEQSMEKTGRKKGKKLKKTSYYFSLVE